jgi:hypothetical protein
MAVEIRHLVAGTKSLPFWVIHIRGSLSINKRKVNGKQQRALLTSAFAKTALPTSKPAEGVPSFENNGKFLETTTPIAGTVLESGFECCTTFLRRMVPSPARQESPTPRFAQPLPRQHA